MTPEQREMLQKMGNEKFSKCFKEQEEIEILNELIEIAIDCGGDAGGPYFSYCEDLTPIMQKWLKFRGMEDKYYVDIKDDDYPRFARTENEL